MLDAAGAWRHPRPMYDRLLAWLDGSSAAVDAAVLPVIIQR